MSYQAPATNSGNAAFKVSSKPRNCLDFLPIMHILIASLLLGQGEAPGCAHCQHCRRQRCVSSKALLSITVSLTLCLAVSDAIRTVSLAPALYYMRIPIDTTATSRSVPEEWTRWCAHSSFLAINAPRILTLLSRSKPARAKPSS
jgi:hypothetical protein